MSVASLTRRRFAPLPGDDWLAPNQSDFGMKSLADAFYLARRDGAAPGPPAYENALKALGVNETLDSEGGVLVAPEHAEELFRSVMDARQWPLSYANRRFTESNTYVWPQIAETDRTTGNRLGGLAAYMVAEAGDITSSFPRLMSTSQRLKKTIIDVVATDELIEDRFDFQALLAPPIADELGFRISDRMIRGTGNDEALGILNSDATITVAKEDSQTAATIVAGNITAMLGRLAPESFARAVWFFVPEAFDQVAALGDGLIRWASPAEAANGSAPMTIAGRPAWPCEVCEPLGTRGDIILADFKAGYSIVSKSRFKQSASMHVKYLSGQQHYRITYRWDGMPTWRKPRTPYKGSVTVSPFVTVETRAA